MRYVTGKMAVMQEVCNLTRTLTSHVGQGTVTRLVSKGLVHSLCKKHTHGQFIWLIPLLVTPGCYCDQESPQLCPLSCYGKHGYCKDGH